MGWAWMLIFGAAALIALWRFGRVRIEYGAAALLLAFAGYAAQGRPDMAGVSMAPTEDTASEAVPETMRRTFASSMNSEGQWLQLGDALINVGRSRAAVSILREGTRRAPQNADVWVGLGNALFIHGKGQMNPAAQYAFERAAQIDPNHPGPPFFMGFALAQSGKLDEAGEIWRGLLARVKDADLKADLEKRLTEIGQMPTAK